MASPKLFSIFQQGHIRSNYFQTAALPAESPSVTLGMRVWVQPAKSDLSVRLLCDQLPKVYVFSAHYIFTIFCAPFPNRISHFKVLVMV